MSENSPKGKIFKFDFLRKFFQESKFLYISDFLDQKQKYFFFNFFQFFFNFFSIFVQKIMPSKAKILLILTYLPSLLSFPRYCLFDSYDVIITWPRVRNNFLVFFFWHSPHQYLSSQQVYFGTINCFIDTRLHRQTHRQTHRFSDFINILEVTPLFQRESPETRMF